MRMIFEVIEGITKLAILMCWFTFIVFAGMLYLMVALGYAIARKPVPRWPRSWSRVPRLRL